MADDRQLRSEQDILAHIQNLVAEEQQLRQATTLPGRERNRLDQIRAELDQCWDLLRQRRAKREFHQNPDEAELRSADTVEKYQG